MLEETEVKLLSDLYENKYNEYVSSISSTGYEIHTELPVNVNDIQTSLSFVEIEEQKIETKKYSFPDNLTDSTYRGPIYTDGAFTSEYSSTISKHGNSLYVMINYEDDKICLENDKLYLHIPDGFLEEKVVETTYMFKVNDQMVLCDVIFDSQKITICNLDGNFNVADIFGLLGYCVCLVCDY